MAFLSLYRKYRPRNFNDLVGQQHVVKTLRNALEHNRVAHAYLFAGPRGTGKTSTAKVFAQALNCTDRQGLDPCGECDNCQRIQSGQSIDVIEIDAASNRGIDEIRDLREKVKFYPSEGSYKVYIIDEVHMLTKGAFNALLKTLEEPPDNVVFILATTEPHKVIDTILSRCQRYDFSLLSLEDIKGRLEYICQQEEADYEEEALNIITRSSNGGMRDAISLLDQAISFTNGQITAKEVQEMLGKVAQEELNLFFGWIIEHNTVDALELVNRLIERGNSISVFVADLIEYTRRLLLIKECGPNTRILKYPAEMLTDLQEKAGSATAARLFRMLEILTDIERKLTFSDQPRLILELGIMKMASPEADNSLEGLQARIATLEERLKNLTGGGQVIISQTVKREETVKHEEDASKAGASPEKEAKKPVKPVDREAEKARNMISASDNSDKIADAENTKADDVRDRDRLNESANESTNESINENVNDNIEEAANSKTNVTDNGNFLQKVQKIWPDVLARVKDENISIQAYLLEGRPVRTSGEVLTIEFPPDKGFHRKGAEKESGLIRKVISQLSGQPCELEFVTQGDTRTGEVKKKPRVVEEDGLVDEIIKLFDGEVIKVDYNVIK